MKTRKCTLMCLLATALVLTYVLPVCADTFHYSPQVRPFVQPLRGAGPGGIPVAVSDGTSNWRDGFAAAHYTIDVNEFTDLLHPDLVNPTTFWGYNPRNALGVTGVPTPKYLGGIIIAQRGKPVQITFNNNLPPTHILPIDRSIPGAEGPDNRIVTHLHGGLVPWISDGGPHAWWTPSGLHGPSWKNDAIKNPANPNQAEFYYPNNQSARFVWYHDHAIGITRINAYGGIASAYIIRDNFESNVLVKLLGLPKFIENGGRELPLIIQDKIFQNAADPDPAFPGAQGAGNLWYPYIYDPNRWDLLDTGTPPPVPSVVAEMFGDTMLVNGVPEPNIAVDPRHYRLRILNGCQARFLNLQLYEANSVDPNVPDFSKPGPDWLVIGAEGGFIANPVIVPSAPLQITQDPVTFDRMVDPAKPGGSLITAPAERWDAVVDFNGKGGKKYILCNDAPAPYPMGSALNDYPRPGAPNGNTQIIMRFDVKADVGIPAEQKFLITPNTLLAGNPLSGVDLPLAGIFPNSPAGALSWVTLPDVALPVPTRPGIKVRQLTLNETFDGFGRLIQMEGTSTATGLLPPPPPGLADFSLPYAAPATEVVKAGSTEVWQIANLTGDVHPIHIHLVNAQLLSRRPFDVGTYLTTPVGQPAKLVYIGQPRGPDPTEMGWKETIKMFPGEVTTIIMKFDLPKTPFKVPFSTRAGLGVANGYEYVWHCHILEHEEHDMMRPLVVIP